MISWRWGAAAGGRYMILPWLISSWVKYWMGEWGRSLCSMIPREEETHEYRKQLLGDRMARSTNPTPWPWMGVFIIQEHWLLSCSSCTTAVKLLKKRTGLEPDGSASRALAMKALTPQHPWVRAHICKASVRETEIGRTPGLASQPA